MKLKFLGTGAADWNIEDYESGKFHRRLSSVLIDGDLLVDPGPNIFHFAETEGTPDMLDGVKNIIVTHSHGDHFCPETVKKLCYGKDVALWADPVCLKVLKNALGEDVCSGICFHETHVRQPEPYRIGDYEIWSLTANHFSGDPEEITRLYLIGKGGRMLYYGCDSAWIPTDSWYVIKYQPINVMIMECTCGTLAPNDWRIFDHNTVEMLELMLTTFRKYNYFAPDVRYYISHLSKTMHTDHETLSEDMKKLGVTPAYDGLEIEI